MSKTDLVAVNSNKIKSNCRLWVTIYHNQPAFDTFYEIFQTGRIEYLTCNKEKDIFNISTYDLHI